LGSPPSKIENIVSAFTTYVSLKYAVQALELAREIEYAVQALELVR
jgi:hypothetical protein